jgi:glycosyltransferase Alg8
MYSEDKDRYFWPFLLYILFIILYAYALPRELFDPYQRKLIIVLGIIGGYRYAWFFLNNIRAYRYKNYKFKKVREQEQNAGSDIDPEHLFLLITSFRISESVTIKTYREAVKDAIASGYNVTLIASIVEVSEERLVRKIFMHFDPPERVKLVITRIKGTGKRDALAAGYRVIANQQGYDFEKCVVAVIDGDSIVTPGTFTKCSRLFGLDPKLGGLTTDEDSMLIKPPETTSEYIYLHWYRLRFAQRNISMSSVALSDRVLTLTGRMSMIRANIVVEAAFVKAVQSDYIHHWRLGTFSFLTGDDKSSLYYVMKKGWRLTYVPDVMVYTVDELVSDNFVLGSLELMNRWFGNQYRTNLKQMQVKDMRTRIGNFPWYSIYDQRLTKWMTPYGFFIAVLGTIHWGIYVLFAYIWWVLFSRLLMVFVYRLSRKDIHPLWPFFMYYNQLIGSFTKIYIWEHLYKQGWSRQKTKLKKGEKYIEWYYVVSSNGMVMLKMTIFLITIGFLVQVYNFEDLWLYLHFLKGIVE